MSGEINFSDEVTVKLVRSMADDNMVVQAAQVSAKGENNPETAPERLIRALMTGKHGSPFEHNAFTFFIEAPIFVFREWQRHRISSFNEMSGRYTELLPKFYIPGVDRKLINSGTKMKPSFIKASHEVWRRTISHQMTVSNVAWDAYKDALDKGVANEVARMILPLNIYSQMYWTVNARSLMNFLSLRVESEDSAVKSYPQLEIQLGADKIEDIFKEKMPLTHKVFIENGRVAP